MSSSDILKTAQALRWEVSEDLHDNLMGSLYEDAENIASQVVSDAGEKKRFSWEQRLDKILTGKFTAFPIMLVLLSLVFWITIVGANYPSELLADVLIDTLQPLLKGFMISMGSPDWLNGLLVDGVYLSAAAFL